MKIPLTQMMRGEVESNSFLVRPDCDLQQGKKDAYFRTPRAQVGRYGEATFFQLTMS